MELQTTAQWQQQSDIRELKPGQSIERGLDGLGSHEYRIVLEAGQNASVAVEQKGIDVVAVLLGANGQKIAEVDSVPGNKTESISIVAEVSGEYVLKVRPREKDAETGRYEIRILDWRSATSGDRDRFAAQASFWEADQLRATGTADSLRNSIEKYQKALLLWRAVEDRWREAATLNQLGVVHSYLGDRQKALQYHNEALPLRRAEQDLRGESITLSNIGTIHVNIGEPRKALEYYNQSLTLKQAVGDRKSEANTLYNIASVHLRLGELQKALEYFDRALPITRATRERLGEALTLSSIGSVYYNMGEWQKALEYESQALVLVRGVGSHRSEAVILHNIGTVYSQLGDLPKALEYYDQALPLRRAAGDKSGEAYTLNSIGSAHLGLGDTQKALNYYNQALSLNRAVGDKNGEAYFLSNVGAAYARLGDIRQAMDYFNQALRVSQTVGDRRGEAFSLREIGFAYVKLKEPQKAIEYYTRAIALSRAIGDRHKEALVLGDIAQVQLDQGNLGDARTSIEASLGIIESTRSSLSSQELRASYLTTKRRDYDLYIDLLMRMHKDNPTEGYDSLALQASERARARSLLDMLTEANADIRQGVDPALLEQQRTLQQQLDAKSERLTRLLSTKHTEEQERTARSEVDALVGAYRDVQAQIRARSPRYAALTQPEPLTLKEIQQQVLDDDTLLLEYVLGEERSFLWAVTANSIKSFELPSRAVIDAEAQRVYELLVKKADALYPEPMTNLSRMLLKPVADLLGRKRLLIVSEGTLQYVPFGALPTPKASNHRSAGSSHQPVTSTPLILNHEIVSLPSASVLAVLRHELGGRRPAPKRLAVLADPVFEASDQRVKQPIKSQIEEQDKKNTRTEKIGPPSDIERSSRELGINTFDRLLLSRREAQVITALASNGEPMTALDFAASRATATSPQLDQYRIVHFATHSLLNNRHPELSGIVLSLVDEQGVPQNGFLRLYEVYNLKLAADLVVLSACQTALGKEIKGEGLVGLTRGFMYAGAPRVVASLWKVSDKATAELMKRFYEKMIRERMRPAAALRAAQVSMLKERQWQSSYYWSAFVLQGEWK